MPSSPLGTSISRNQPVNPGSDDLPWHDFGHDFGCYGFPYPLARDSMINLPLPRLLPQTPSERTQSL